MNVHVFNICYGYDLALLNRACYDMGGGPSLRYFFLGCHLSIWIQSVRFRTPWLI
jgi:hypothetical protein